MREVGRRMAENQTPETSPELEKATRDLMKNQSLGRGPTPGQTPIPLTQGTPKPPRAAQTTPVDARPAKLGDDKRQERVIAEWYSDRPVDRNGQVSQAPAAEEMQRAADAADRAVEQQTVPARYNGLIKRVFKRYSEQVPAAKEAPKN